MQDLTPFCFQNCLFLETNLEGTNCNEADFTDSRFLPDKPILCKDMLITSKTMGIQIIGFEKYGNVSRENKKSLKDWFIENGAKYKVIQTSLEDEWGDWSTWTG